MKRFTVLVLALLPLTLNAHPDSGNDPRIKIEQYNPEAVVTLYAKRGVTTQIQLDPSEEIDYVSTGVGSRCEVPTDTWCIVAPQHGHDLFIKPKSEAQGTNNIAVATNKRAYSFRLVMLSDHDKREPLYRLSFDYARPKEEVTSATVPQALLDAAKPITPWPMPTAGETVKERLKQAPQVKNAQYSMKIGRHSKDIAPVLVFDDGRFTYFKFPNNREVPAVFEVDAEGNESTVNVEMQMDPATQQLDLLRADRVSRKFYLRRGKMVVGVWNDGFDVDGVPPVAGTTVAGVERVLKSEE